MSEEEQKPHDPNPASGAQGQEPGDQPAKSPAEKLSSAWLLLGAIFVWEAIKKLAGASLRKAVEQSAPGADSGIDEDDRPSLPERAYDRDITPGLDRSRSRRHWGTFLNVLLCFAAVGGGVGFLYVYWTGGSNEALGGFLAIFLAGLAVGLVVNAHLLVVHKEASEVRESTQSPPEERAAASEAFRCGELQLQRRGLLKWMAAIGLGTVAAMFVSLLRSIMPDPYSTLDARVWKSGQRLMSSDGQPVRADALPTGSTTIVFPEDSIGEERSQTVLIRVDPQLLELPAGRAGWAPLGNLAFSRICTHAGCSVGMYEKTAHLLMCPCHQSTFDVLRAAQPTGGPAARPLPQLPLYVDAEGILRAGGEFTTPPGPGFWEMPS